MLSVPDVVAHVRQRRAAPDAPRTLLVAVSGIDAAGKGHVAHQVAHALRPDNVRVAVLTPEAWAVPLAEHRRAADPAEHYYRNACRFADLFRLLIDPLRETGTVRLTTRVERNGGAEWEEFQFEFERVEVVLLEGVFLLKREYRHRYDLAYWVECTHETALERARQRSPFGLLDDELVQDYEAICRPAQQLHLERDDPKGYVNGVIANDPRLSDSA